MALKVFSSFVFGLYNSFYAFNFSALLVVLILNDILAKRLLVRSQIFVVSFVLIYWLVNCVSILGLFDFFLGQKLINLLKIGNLLLASFFLYLGILNFKERVQYQKDHDMRYFKVWPFVANETMTGRPRLNKFVALILGGVVATLLGLLGSIWPQDYFLFLLNNELLTSSPDNVALALFAFMSYSFGLSVPILIGVWGWQKVQNNMETSRMAFTKVCSSAVLIGVSLSLFYVILLG